jgi:hypothetical protein
MPIQGLVSDVQVQEVDYYVDQYSRNGLHGPGSLPLPKDDAIAKMKYAVNWYRTRRVNYEEDLG